LPVKTIAHQRENDIRRGARGKVFYKKGKKG